jgi:N-acetyl-alpha-D-muramate 1-phosphate uridylyltransferase
VIAMILAAGRGERLRPITDQIPKALVEVRDISLLERHLKAVKAAGIENVVINLGWLGELITERVGSGSRYGLSVVYSPEGENVLETGGGIHRALPLLGPEKFLVVNADVFTDMPLPVDLPVDSDGHLIFIPKPAHKEQGDFDLIHGHVANSENPELTFSGVAIYRPEFFVDCEPGRFPLAPMLRRAADNSRLTGTVYDGVWEDVGTPERLQELNRQ